MFNIGDEVRLIPGVSPGQVYDEYTIWSPMIFVGTKKVIDVGCDSVGNVPWVKIDHFYYPESVLELAYHSNYDVPSLEEFNQLLMSNDTTFLFEDFK